MWSVAFAMLGGGALCRLLCASAGSEVGFMLGAVITTRMRSKVLFFVGPSQVTARTDLTGVNLRILAIVLAGLIKRLRGAITFAS